MGVPALLALAAIGFGCERNPDGVQLWSLDGLESAAIVFFGFAYAGFSTAHAINRDITPTMTRCPLPGEQSAFMVPELRA